MSFVKLSNPPLGPFSFSAALRGISPQIRRFPGIGKKQIGRHCRFPRVGKTALSCSLGEGSTVQTGANHPFLQKLTLLFWISCFYKRLITSILPAV
jgi:hypothetical protein